MAGKGTVHIKFDGDIRGLEAALNKGLKHTNKFASSLQGLVAPMAAAFSVGAIVSYSKEALDLAGKLEGIKEAFDRLNQPMLLDELKKATKGTVSELELMKNAVKANNFKIALEQLPTLFEFATKRAAQTGESVDYLVESIILGIGRKSPLILDNLGISAIELREKLKGVGMESASVADVTRAMAEVVDGELARMGDVSLTTGQKMQQIAVSAEELKTVWGGFVASIANAGMFSWIKEELEYLTWGLNKVKEEGSGFKSWWNWFWQTGDFGSDRFEIEKENGEGWKKNATYLSGLNNQMKTYNDLVNESLKNNLSSVDGQAKEVESLEVLRQQLKELMDQREKAALADVRSYDEPIKKLQEKIALYELEKDKIKQTTAEIEEKLRAEREAADQFLKNIRSSLTGKEFGNDVIGTVDFAGKQVDVTKNNGIYQLKPEDSAEGLQMDLEKRTEYQNQYLEDREAWIAQIEEQNQRLAATMEAVGMAFVNAMGEFIKGEATFGDTVKNLLVEIIKIIAGYLATSVAASFAGGASVGGPAAPFTGAAAAAAAASMFGAIVPALMAEGGRVPSGYPNDSYPAMLTSGETVVPPHKLSEMGGQLSGQFRIQGSDLVYIVNKEQNKLSRNR